MLLYRITVEAAHPGIRFVLVDLRPQGFEGGNTLLHFIYRNRRVVKVRFPLLLKRSGKFSFSRSLDDGRHAPGRLVITSTEKPLPFLLLVSIKCTCVVQPTTH